MSLEKNSQIRALLRLLNADPNAGNVIQIQALLELYSSSAVAGNTTEIQYNNNGVFGSDPNFTRDPISGDTTISHNVNDAALIIGDSVYGGLVNGVVIQDVNGTDLFGLYVGLEAIGEGNKASLAYLDTVGGELINIFVDEDFGASLQYLDNVFETTLETGIVADSLKVQLKYIDTSIGTPIDNKIELDETGVKFTSDASSYTFPLTDGTAGQILSTDGAGNLSWITP